MHIFLFVYFQTRGLPLILTLLIFQGKHPTIHFCLKNSLKFPDFQKVTLLKICVKNILFIEKSQS